MSKYHAHHRQKEKNDTVAAHDGAENGQNKSDPGQKLPNWKLNWPIV
ncbi:MAG: hypothetical protein LBB68_00390 [Treponema sp.]|jgi:hypothetical protein|nr:hypothetical protein [Treponema sp.]